MKIRQLYIYFAFTLLAIGYAIVTNSLVTPIAVNWGADYDVYIRAIESDYVFELQEVLLNSSNLSTLIIKLAPTSFYTLVYILGTFDIDASTSLSIISATAAFIIAFYVLEKSRNKIFLIFLFSPLLLDLIYFQLRNGFALALFFIGLLLENKSRIMSYLFFIISILFHSSLVLFIVIYLIAEKTQQSQARTKNHIKEILLNLVIGASIATIYLIANSNFHRSSYMREDLSQQPSIVGIIFFLSLVILYVINGRSFIQRFKFQNILSIVLLCLYPFFEQTLRVFATSLPFHIIAFSNARNKTLPFLLLFAFTLFNILNWQPFLDYVIQ